MFELQPAQGYRIRCDFGTGKAIGFFLLWVILTLVTLGVGLFFIQYYAMRAIANTSVVLDGANNEVGRFQCKLNFIDFLGHAILWILLCFVTFGLALIVYALRVPKYVNDNTRIVPIT